MALEVAQEAGNRACDSRNATMGEAPVQSLRTRYPNVNSVSGHVLPQKLPTRQTRPRPPHATENPISPPSPLAEPPHFWNRWPSGAADGMGINGFYDVIGPAEVKSIADLAADHYQQHGRPLRIAVDEAHWRFRNLNADQQDRIRETTQRASNPIVKAILYRIVGLLKLGLQLRFVFDGPARPWKKGRPSNGHGSLADRQNAELLKTLLNTLSVPYHEAPGEAEAECALLQREGVVDAVWSEDSDALMFGCTLLFRDLREEDRKKSKTCVRVHTAEQIRKCGLDPAGIVLFALISGADYDNKGLPGCGSKRALKVAGQRLSQSLRNLANSADFKRNPVECARTSPAFARWRGALEDGLNELDATDQRRSQPIKVPREFPDARALKSYQHPKVSGPDQITYDQMQAIQKWEADIDERRLRPFLLEKFNFSPEKKTDPYLTHIEPLFFVRSLLKPSPEQRGLNSNWQAKILKKTKTSDPSEQSVRIHFLPRQFHHLSPNVQAAHSKGDMVECEVPRYILKQSGLFGETVEQTPASTQTKTTAKPAPPIAVKRKSSDESSGIDSARKRQKTDSSRPLIKTRLAPVSGTPLLSRPAQAEHLPSALPSKEAHAGVYPELQDDELDNDDEDNDLPSLDALLNPDYTTSSPLSAISPNLPKTPAPSLLHRPITPGTSRKTTTALSSRNHLKPAPFSRFATAHDSSWDVEVIDLT